MKQVVLFLLVAVTACSGSDTPSPVSQVDSQVDTETTDSTVSDATAPDSTGPDSTDSTGPDSDSTDTTPTDPCTATGCGQSCGPEDLWSCEPLWAGSVCRYDGTGVAQRLLSGLTRLDFAGGLPSRLIVHGPDAFPVLVDDQHHVVIAGAYVDQGRALVIGHEGPLGHRLTSGTGMAGLWQNAASWLTGQGPGQTSGVIGVMPGYADLADDLAEAGWVTRTLAPSDLTEVGLADVDLLVMDTYETHSAATLGAIHTWLSNGGALLAGGHAWWWAASDPAHTDAALNYPGNALLAPTGITIVESTASDAPYPLPDSHASNLDQARFAIDILTREREGCTTLSPEDRARAASSAGGAIDVLPLDSDFVASARPFSDAVGPVMPTASSPLVLATNPIDALAARLQIRLALDADPDDVVAHPASADFPGPVSEEAPRVSRTLVIDGDYVGAPNQFGYGAPDAAVWRSTGLYAAPGEVIEVTVPSRAIAMGLTVQVGIHTDLLWDKDEWSRLPRIVATRPIDTVATRIASGFGGPVYITVPVGSALGELEVTVANAVPMATFVAGADWPAELAHGAPWAELIGTSLVLHVPIDDARDLTDPVALMTLWDQILAQNAWLGGIPTARPRAERFVVDRQISAGWMHSGYPIMAHLESATEVLDLAETPTAGAWGPLHELGHNHQNLDWVLPGTTESSVNLWSVHISEQVLGLDRDVAHPALSPAERAARIAAWRAGTDRDWSVWMALETYLMLQEAFGWDFYHRLFGRYLTLTDRPVDDDARTQRFIELASLEADKDLTDFFAAWGLEANLATRAAVDHLPPWSDHPLAP